MEDQVSAPMFSDQFNSSKSNNSQLLQVLMVILGWKNIAENVKEIEIEARERDQQLQTILNLYQKEPASYRQKLINTLQEFQQIWQEEYNDAVKQGDLYKKQAEQEIVETQSSAYVRWRDWIQGGVKNFFGSSARSLEEKYISIAEDRYLKLNHTKEWLTRLYTEQDREQYLQTLLFPEVIPLSDLDGGNGFVLDGEGGANGFAVSGSFDFNGDGYDDVLIGAPNCGSVQDAGCSYVVFGGPEIGDNGMLSLSKLNGLDGFKMYGDTVDGFLGTVVESVGDVNRDGYDDILIADSYASQGNWLSYVVFGGPQVGSSGVLSLTTLDGTNGFNISNSKGQIWSSGGAGDINGDQYDDLILQATDGFYVIFGSSQIAPNGTFDISAINGANGFSLSYEPGVAISQSAFGEGGDINGDNYDDLVIVLSSLTYLIFGNPKIGASGALPLASLDGDNGFRMYGDPANAASMGDINSDGRDDLIIGVAFGSGPGCTYIVFGKPGIGRSGTFNLSSMTSADGFKIYGENSHDYAGSAVSSAGDINTDGNEDLIIGAYGFPSGSIAGSKGRSYVIFGGPGIGSSGNFELSSINGTNGIKLDGEYIEDRSGTSVSAAGDVNGDGVDDFIIGAPGYPEMSNQGRTYLVYGDAYSPQLITNSLTITRGQKLLVSDQILKATDPHQSADSLWFNISSLQHGYFVDAASGESILRFNQSQIKNQQIMFVHEGSELPPSYDVQVHHKGTAVSPTQSASITFHLTSPTPDSDTSLKQTIITAATSGCIGILFAVVQACLKRAANKKLLQILGEEQDDFDRDVVSPVAKEIARQVKITGFMNFTTNSQIVAFKASVRTLLTELDGRNVNLRFVEMGDIKKDGLINEIAIQTKLQLVPPGCCVSFCAFFRAQAKPEDIRRAAPQIADRVVDVLTKRSARLMSAHPQRKPPVSGGKNLTGYIPLSA